MYKEVEINGKKYLINTQTGEIVFSYDTSTQSNLSNALLGGLNNSINSNIVNNIGNIFGNDLAGISNIENRSTQAMLSGVKNSINTGNVGKNIIGSINPIGNLFGAGMNLAMNSIFSPVNREDLYYTMDKASDRNLIGKDKVLEGQIREDFYVKDKFNSSIRNTANTLGSVVPIIGHGLGAAIGAVRGLFNKDKWRDEAEKYNKEYKEEYDKYRKSIDLPTLQNYNTTGVDYSSYYPFGGTINQTSNNINWANIYEYINPNSKKQIFPYGGLINNPMTNAQQPNFNVLSNRAVEGIGGSHAQGGVPIGSIEIEGDVNKDGTGEVIIGNKVFSDRINIDKKRSVASVAKELETKLKKLTDKKKNSNLSRLDRTTIDREISNINNDLESLYNRQEKIKKALGLDKLANLMNNVNTNPQQGNVNANPQQNDVNQIEQANTINQQPDVQQSLPQFPLGGGLQYYFDIPPIGEQSKYPLNLYPKSYQNIADITYGLEQSFFGNPNINYKGNYNDLKVKLNSDDVFNSFITFKGQETPVDRARNSINNTLYDLRYNNFNLAGLTPAITSGYGTMANPTLNTNLDKSLIDDINSYLKNIKLNIPKENKNKTKNNTNNTTTVNNTNNNLNLPYIPLRDLTYLGLNVNPEVLLQNRYSNNDRLYTSGTNNTASKSSTSNKANEANKPTAQDKKLEKAGKSIFDYLKGSGFNAKNALMYSNLFLDNLVNYNLTKKTPEIPKPNYLEAAKLKTGYNIQPQLTELARSEGAYNKLIKDLSSSGASARANILANRANTISSRNKLYGIKENYETQLLNQSLLNAQNIANQNRQLRDIYNMMVAQREAGLLQDYSKNIDNLSRDINFIINNENLKDYQRKQILADLLKYTDSTVFRNSIKAGLLDLDKNSASILYDVLIDRGTTDDLEAAKLLKEKYNLNK